MRGCSSVEAPESCYGGGTTLIQYKDCSVTCDPADQSGCNTGLAEVAEKFSTKKVSTCYQCEFVQNVDGTVTGTEGCGQEVTQGNPIPPYHCPVYADSACFWSASFHQDFTNTARVLN